MAGFSDPVQSGVAGTSTIDDDLDPSVLIEGSDGLDYFELVRSDSGPKIILAAGGAKTGIGGTPDLCMAGGLHIIEGSSALSAASGNGDLLVLESDQHSGMTFTVPADKSSYIFFADNSTNGVCWIAADQSADSLTLKSTGPSMIQTGGEHTRLHIDANGKISTGGSTANPGTNAAAGSLHVYTGDTSHTQVHEDWDEIVIEGNAGNRSGLTIMSVTNGRGGIAFTDPNNAQAAMITYDHALDLLDLIGTPTGTTVPASILRLYGTGVIIPQKGALQYHQGTGADTATTQAVYLPSGSSGAKIIVDFANGNVGDITLTAAVTSIDFYNVPADGTSATVTARITQDSSNRTIDYSDSAVSCFSGAGSGAVTGEIKFSGGVHHTQSTGSGDVDIISFTSIPTGSTFNIYAAVIGQDFS